MGTMVEGMTFDDGDLWTAQGYGFGGYTSILCL